MQLLAAVAVAGRGGAVLMVSTDLAELLEVCDRIAVMFAGRIAGEVRPEDTSEDEIGLLMSGAGQSLEPGRSNTAENSPSPTSRLMGSPISETAKIMLAIGPEMNLLTPSSSNERLTDPPPNTARSPFGLNGPSSGW
ncbi:MAG: hypothetical protein IH789_06890, partial [Acidobacteria bacterium]|nr:hypothetical protein [Acidobacteriota bacterium]